PGPADGERHVQRPYPRHDPLMPRVAEPPGPAGRDDHARARGDHVRALTKAAAKPDEYRRDTTGGELDMSDEYSVFKGDEQVATAAVEHLGPSSTEFHFPS